MSITIKTLANRKGTASVESSVDKCATSGKTHFLDATQGSINADIKSGCQAGQTVTGPGRVAIGGKDVVIEATASAAGTVALEDSPDGLTWTQVAVFPLTADVPQGFRFAPQVAQYRVKFTASTAGAASRVTVYTQSRT